MKKSFLLLPVIALGLSACSNTSSEQGTAADVTSIAMPDWQSTSVQPVEMPSTMNQPTYQPQVQTQIQPPVTIQPQYQPQAVPVNVQSVTQPTYQPNTMSASTEAIGNCQVVRDSNNTPVYAQIQKGCYTDSSYTVGKYDTVFLIAYLAGKNVSEIAALNNLTQPYQLRMGQILRLK